MKEIKAWALLWEGNGELVTCGGQLLIFYQEFEANDAKAEGERVVRVTVRIEE